MVYIKRDSDNNIIAIFDKNTKEKLEQIDTDHEEVIAFLARCELSENYHFLRSDLDLIRVIEDLIQILIAKNIVSITDFPIQAIKKLVQRNKIRAQYSGVSSIMDQL